MVYANFAASYPVLYAVNRTTSLSFQNGQNPPLLHWCTYRDTESETFPLNATHIGQTYTIFPTATRWKVKGKEREWFGDGIYRSGPDILILWKLPFLAAFWLSTSVCSGKHMESYKRVEIMDIRWNGWFITMLMEVPAVFRMEQNHNLVLKTAAVETLWPHLDYMCVCFCSCDMIRVRMSICRTGKCMSCCSSWFDRVPEIRDVHHGLFPPTFPSMIIHNWAVGVLHWSISWECWSQCMKCTKSTCVFMSHRQT